MDYRIVCLYIRKINNPYYLILPKVPQDVVLRNLTIYGIVTSLCRARLAERVLPVSALILVKSSYSLRSGNKAIYIPMPLAL